MDVNQCQVCGNSPARSCYNAVVCNPCCIFFYRCVANHPPKVCQDSNNCVTTSGSRKSCSYCRFQRCLSLNMAVNKVAKKKRYNRTLHIHSIPQQTMVAMVKHYRPLLIPRDHTLSALSIDSLLMWHKLSLNEYGKNSSSLPVNMNISLAEAIKDPTALASRETERYYLFFINFIIRYITKQNAITSFQACIKRLRPSDSHSELESYVVKSYSRSHCRFIVSYIDFLISTHYFNELSPQDKEHLAQDSITTFVIFCFLKSRLKYGQVSTKAHCDQYKVMDHEKKVLTGCLGMMNTLFSTVIHPLYVELDFDEMEVTAVQAIAIYSSAVELSDDGMKKVFSARDAFTLKLMEYIENTRPELTRHQQLDRLSKLLGVVNKVREVGRLRRELFVEIVVNNYGGMDGKITSDIYVNSK